MGESGHPVPFTEIEEKRTPDCSWPIPIGESTRRVIGSSLKNTSTDPLSGDDVTYESCSGMIQRFNDYG